MSNIVIIIGILFFFTLIGSSYFLIIGKNSDSENNIVEIQEEDKQNKEKININSIDNNKIIEKEICYLKHFLFFIVVLILNSLLYVRFGIKMWITTTISLIIYGIIKDPYLMTNIKKLRKKG